MFKRETEYLGSDILSKWRPLLEIKTIVSVHVDTWVVLLDGIIIHFLKEWFYISMSWHLQGGEVVVMHLHINKKLTQS